MSEVTPNPRRILHLVIDGFPAEKLAEIVESSPKTEGVTEVFTLSKTNSREALGLIFSSDTVAVWSKL